MERIRVIETHISFVLLTGRFAYKIKKHLDLGFLDFTSLDKRHHFCDEELRLNSRLSPQIYLDVVPIGGTQDAPRIGDGEGVMEYAVRMREFDQHWLADRALARGELLPRHVDALAQRIADFHASVPRTDSRAGYGSPEAIRAPMEQNFAQLRALAGNAAERSALDSISDWSAREHARLENTFERRVRDGWVRECHGDLHLGNIVLMDGEPQIFDCIEFNPNLRWIDVENETAFLTMDFAERGRSDLANRFLNACLEAGGDYEGLSVLRFYLVYRAVVRAKIARIRAQQDGIPAEASRVALDAWTSYMGYAQRTMQPRDRALLITHGLSGSGKTTVSQVLVEALGIVRIRSDVERKRLHGLAATVRSGSTVGAGAYTGSATGATYRRLVKLARQVLLAGFPVLLDATFLSRDQRDLVRDLARDLAVPFLILDCRAPEAVLRARVAARERAGTDASEATRAVLDHQLRTVEALGGAERADALAIDTPDTQTADLVRSVRRRLGYSLPAHAE
ncbi:MAG TPA: AAA family ATPase [Burkholderiales bacterium]|nr:AAA family ATPase [Burkholderiales bacterium]